jgi:hypothetical protein
MKRRPVEADKRPQVPADIAAGPCVELWASPESLALLAESRSSEEAKKGILQREDVRLSGSVARVVELSAHDRWADAKRAWADEHGLTSREMSHLLYCRPGPYFGPPRSWEGYPSSYDQLRHPELIPRSEP